MTIANTLMIAMGWTAAQRHFNVTLNYRALVIVLSTNLLLGWIIIESNKVLGWKISIPLSIVALCMSGVLALIFAGRRLTFFEQK